MPKTLRFCPLDLHKCLPCAGFTQTGARLGRPTRPVGSRHLHRDLSRGNRAVHSRLGADARRGRSVRSYVGFALPLKEPKPQNRQN